MGEKGRVGLSPMVAEANLTPRSSGRSQAGCRHPVGQEVQQAPVAIGIAGASRSPSGSGSGSYPDAASRCPRLCGRDWLRPLEAAALTFAAVLQAPLPQWLVLRAPPSDR